MKKRIEDVLNELENPHFHDLDRPHLIGFNPYISDVNRARLNECRKRWKQYRLHRND